MEEFKAIYQILEAVRVAMDYEKFDFNNISPERLKITEQKRDELLVLLLKKGYLEGGVMIPLLKKGYLEGGVMIPLYGGDVGIKWLGKPRITLDGLEYLEENSMMKKSGEFT